MSVVKVQFTRVENEAEINNTQIKDGQLLYTRDGKIYIDYGTARKKITSLIELLTVDSTAPAECSLGDMYYNTTTNLIYTAIGTDTWSSTGELPSNKYLYVDLTNARLYYYDGVSFTSYGGGGSITMDTQMSDSSENAVQNKVIKQYVDTEISSIPEEVIISNTQPSSSSNKIWIDTGEIAQAHTEITNSYSTSTGLGYSCNYINGIVESGSNTNGNWIKYVDGTLICTIIKTINIAINTAWGSLYVGDTNVRYTYPITFVGNDPIVNYSITGSNSAFVVSWLQSSNKLEETDRFALVRGNTASAQDYVLNITAIGRWK